MHGSMIILSSITRHILKEIHKTLPKSNKMQLSLKFSFTQTKLIVKTDRKYVGQVPRSLLNFVPSKGK